MDSSCEHALGSRRVLTMPEMGYLTQLFLSHCCSLCISVQAFPKTGKMSFTKVLLTMALMHKKMPSLLLTCAADLNSLLQHQA